MSLTGPVDRYFAFWSDTSLHFAAQIMFPVQAGDRVTARLTLAGGRWIASMTDLNSHHSSAVTTADETSSVLDLAEWVQEDPAAALGSGRPYPYPDLSPIRVHDLEVNSSEPRDADVNSVWMDRGNTYLAPGPLSDAGFALRRATLTPAGRRYLRIVAAEKAAVGTFAQRLAGWTAATHISQIASERKVLADVLHATVKALASATWPLATRASVRALVAQTRALETRTRSGPTLSRGGITAWRTAWLFEAHFADTAALAARRALRLPQGMPAGCHP